MAHAAPDPIRQQALLNQVANAIEELLLSGTTTASDATARTLGMAFEQAAQAGLLRVGASLRIVLEELKRLNTDPERFSTSRLAFFLDRCWLLAKGTLEALQDNDQQDLVRLTAPMQANAYGQLSVATAGVLKRHVPGAFSAFEFRLRLLQPAQAADGSCLAAGTALQWSFVVPAAAGHQFPAEAFLSMRQKQGFSPAQLLTNKAILIDECRVSRGETMRVNLGPNSKLTFTKEPVANWPQLLQWQPQQWLKKLRAHRPDPLELPNELSQEVLLNDWRLCGDFAPSTLPGRELSERSVELSAMNMRWRLRIDRGETELEQALRKAASSQPQPALYASTHVELGKAVLTPLSLLDGAPKYITIAKPEYDRAAMVRLLNRR